MTPEPDDIAPLAVPVIDGQLGLLDSPADDDEDEQ